MSTKLVTYKKKLADGTVKEYVYERAVKDPNEPRKPRTRPVSKRILTEVIKDFSTESLTELIRYAKVLAEKQAKDQRQITDYLSKKSSESDDATDDLPEISGSQPENL